jgi:Bax protein
LGNIKVFTKAKNIFGMWSVDPNEPRIAASEMRSGTRTIWFKKFATIEESVREYYKLKNGCGGKHVSVHELHQ